jgi:hypothetical protein
MRRGSSTSVLSSGASIRQNCRMRRATFSLVGLTLMSAVVVAGQSVAQTTKVMPREQTLDRSVQAGKELKIFTYARWNKSCEPQDPPGIEILNTPAHGKALLRPGSSTVRYIREGEPDCTGHVIPGLAVWYVPEPGFHGTDKFDYHVFGQSTISHDTVVVQVK